MNRATFAEIEVRTARIVEMRARGMRHKDIALTLGTSKTIVWRALNLTEGVDVDDDTPGCPRCGLRGEHECLPARADAYLGRNGEQQCVRNRTA